MGGSEVWLLGGIVAFFAVVAAVVLLALGRMKTYRDTIARVAIEPGREAHIACRTGEAPTWLWLEYTVAWRGQPWWVMQVRATVQVDGKAIYDGEFELRDNSEPPFPRRGVLGYGGPPGRGLDGYSQTGVSKQLACLDDVPAGVPLEIRFTATPTHAVDSIALALVVGAGSRGVLYG
jgi:hypothetical protein